MLVFFVSQRNSFFSTINKIVFFVNLSDAEKEKVVKIFTFDVLNNDLHWKNVEN